MNITLLNSFKLFSDEERKSLLRNLPKPESLDSDYHSYALERAIDSPWFDIVLHSCKNNNRMKIAISSLSNLDIHVHGKTSKYKGSMHWSPNDLDKKMRFFSPIDNSESIELCISVGNIEERFVPQLGYGYIWPAWAALHTVTESNFGMINLDATIIGKKLS